MSLFRSLHPNIKNEFEGDDLTTYRSWPAIYRDMLPETHLNHFTLQIGIENQLPKTMDFKQLSLLPSFTETRNIYSKAGWVYQGVWKGISFQTLFSFFSNPHVYPWVRLESTNNLTYVIERTALLNYRIAWACDGKPLSIAYGGPLWAHCFDNYIEYSIPHIKNIILIQGDYHYSHPNEKLGFNVDYAQVETGNYYSIHQDRNIYFERPKVRF